MSLASDTTFKLSGAFSEGPAAPGDLSFDSPSPSPSPFYGSYDFNYDDDDCSYDGDCNDGFASAAVVIFFCACIFLVLFCIRHRPIPGNTNNTGDATGANGNPTHSRAESENGPAGPAGPAAATRKKMTSSERKTFVSNFLPAKTYKAPIDNGDDDETSVSSGSEHSSSRDDDDNDDDVELGAAEISLRECAVCLDSFQAGDEICTSNNPDCPHVFHRHCMHSWLLKREECPICRRPYLEYHPFEEILL